MKVINRSNSSSSHVTILLVLSLLFTFTSAKLGNSASHFDALNKYYDGSDFDLNDHFKDISLSHRSQRPAHLQTDSVTSATDGSEAPVVQQTGTTVVVGSINNDQLLPTNLFVTPDLALAETHPPEESEGYLQVLQAMKAQPVIVSTTPSDVTPAEQPSGQTKTIYAKPGLNSALLKVLTLSDQFLANSKSQLTSNSMTINQLVQSYAGMAFADTYNPSNAPQAAVVPQRLLTLMRMYAEHVDNQHREVIADDQHYGHLKHMSTHLNCLTQPQCDFNQHLSHFQTTPPTNHQTHLLESYLTQNTHFQANPNSTIQVSIADLIQALPSMTSNDEIRNATSAWLAKNHQALNDLQSAWPTQNQKIQAGLSDLRTNLPIYQNMTPDQLLAILNQMSIQYKQQIDQEFTANGLNHKINDLVNYRNAIDSLHDTLRSVIPINGVLDHDFDRLIQSLNNHINIFTLAQNATEEQLQNARNKLKDNLQMNINGVDPVQNAQLIQSIANNTDAILKANFGQSLNADNLNFIVQKSINALQADLNQINNTQKASGFMLDQADLQKVANDVVDSLKKSRENNQQIILNLADLNREVQRANKEYSALPTSDDNASNAADLLISYENNYYQILSSDETYDQIQNYVANYYDIYRAYVVPLNSFFQYSNAFQTLTAGLNNPNALGNNPAGRLLLASTTQQMDQLEHFSANDKQFFHLINRLTAEWATLPTQHLSEFIHKLDSIIQAVQGRPQQTPIRLLEISVSHHEFALFDQLKSSVMGVIDNLGKSVTAANGLSDTIGNTKNLVQKTADSYQVGDLLTNNGTSASTGMVGNIKNKVKSWLGWRRLDVHFGLMDTIDSVKNLYSSISEAKDSSDKLKTTLNSAQGFANSVHEGIGAFSSLLGKL